MSKKSDKYRLQQPKQQANAVAKPAPAKKMGDQLEMQDRRISGVDPKVKWGLLIVVLISTFLSYSYSLQNQMTNWDDGVYVTENPYIKVINSENIKAILDPRKNITQNYYHPLTLFSLMLNYHFSKEKPLAYYVTNIVIHLLNTALVFFLVMQLLQAMVRRRYGEIKGIVWLAALCALWHGIHPMHVESVSWLAERKDVLYLFFYLIGLITYIRYVEEKSAKWLVYTSIFYLLSLVSKPMAVTFPLSIFAFDILLKRDKEYPFPYWKLILEKTPIFVLSVLAGIAAFIMAKQGGSIGSFQVFTLWERMRFVSYNFMMYFVKAFVPVHQCSFIPYPTTDENGGLPLIFTLAPALAILMVAVPLYLSYKAGENYFRVTLFGMAFYFFNVVFILQFISAGATLMSERYSYAPYFGIVFMVAYFLFELANKKPAWRTPVIAATLGASVMLGYLCYDRTKVWHNTKTLWQDVIAKYPYRIQTSYKNLGNYYADLGPTNPVYFDSAFTNYEIPVKKNMADAGTYSNIANIYGIHQQWDKSLEAYGKALALDSTSFDAHLDRAITLSMMKRYDEALVDYNYAYRKDPKSEKVLENRASTFENAGMHDKAIIDFNSLIAINPDNASYYNQRGASEFNKGDYKPALEDFTRSNSMAPNNGQCLYNLAVTYEHLQDYQSALKYAQMAQQVKFDVSAQYLQHLQQEASTKKH